jgi:hypothetical protein
VNWSAFFLGLIAVATLIMAVIQVGVMLYAGRLARRVDRLTSLVEQDIKPVLENVNAISVSAARVASLAVAQAERADRLFADVSQRVDETVTLIQSVVVAPVREGRAVLAAVAAALAAFREIRQGSRPRHAPLDEEDPLFIG